MHSRWNGYEERSLLGCGVFPLRRTSRLTSSGPAPRMDDFVAEGEEEQQDIVDEALYFLKPHLLLRTFPIKGAGDRTILYVTMYLHECLKKIIGLKCGEATAVVLNYATASFESPGDKGFSLNQFFLTGDRTELSEWQAYARQLRVEAGARLVEKVFMFPEENGTGSKFWMSFAKRSFLASG